MSFTQLSTFLQCRQKWYLQYVLGIKPRRKVYALDVGDAVHQALAKFLSLKPAEDGIQEWYESRLRDLPLDDPELRAQIETIRADATAITNRALQGLEELGYWTYTHNERPMVESEFVVPVSGWTAGMIVKLDWLAYDPLNQAVWSVDFKTRGYFTTEDDEWANLQNAMYHAGALLNDIPCAGTLTYQIKSTAPKAPKLNKDGSMSRADVACDWQSYVAALEANGLDPQDYLEMRGKLDNKEFCRPTKVIRTPEQLERVWNDVVEPTVRAIAATYDHWKHYGKLTEGKMILRNLGPRSCNMCSMPAICHGELKGYDVSNLIGTTYDANADGSTRFGSAISL